MDDLEDEYIAYRSLAELSRRARERARANPSDRYVAEIHVAGLTKKVTDRKAAIDEHFDRVDKALFEQFLVRLVATFERLAFVKLGTALGEARSALQKHYDSSHPFSRAAQHLVKHPDDFRNLADLDGLLASYPQAPCKEFQELREHRNYVTHGGRVGKQSRFVSIDEIHRTLRELLRVIGVDDA